MEHPEASYVYCNYFFGWKKMPSIAFDIELLREQNFIMTTSLMRREVFPGFDESLKRFQDWDLWLTMLEQGHTGVCISEFLFRVIPHRGGISSWLPRCAYKKPWRSLPFIRSCVKRYDDARAVVMKKHGLV